MTKPTPRVKPVAYAIGFIDTRQTPPAVVSVGIFTAPAEGITTEMVKAFAFNITRHGGETIEEARTFLTAHLEHFYPWAWKLYAGS